MLQYLQDVLGIRWIPAPASSPKVEVLARSGLSSVEMALIERMMNAVGLRDYRVVNDAAFGPGVTLVMDESWAERLDLLRVGESALHQERKFLRTHSPEKLLEGTTDQINGHKRQAWEHLKSLKSWIEESR